MELERQRGRFKDEVALLASENEELQGRVDELKNEIVSICKSDNIRKVDVHKLYPQFTTFC